jgi:hypothetical protein
MGSSQRYDKVNSAGEKGGELRETSFLLKQPNVSRRLQRTPGTKGTSPFHTGGGAEWERGIAVSGVLKAMSMAA